MITMNTGYAMSTAVHHPARVYGGENKSVDSVSTLNSTERQFGEHFDTSSHSAVIQMMISTFGPARADLFDEVKRVGSGYDVTLKDGYKLHVSDHEVHGTASASRFVGGDANTVENANFALAVFVKRKQLSSSDSRISSSFNAALTTSLQGETASNLLKGMGMGRFMQQIPSEQLVGRNSVGVMEAHNFGAALIRDGVAHRFDRQYRPDRPYVYVLDKEGKRLSRSSEMCRLLRSMFPTSIRRPPGVAASPLTFSADLTRPSEDSVRLLMAAAMPAS